MLQDNPLLQQLKAQIRESLPTKEGTIKATERGFGFLETEDGKSVFVPPPYMKRVCHGDKVKAVVRTEKDRDVAEPESLVEAALDTFIGRVSLKKDKLMVAVDHPLQNQLFAARADKSARGDKQTPWQEGDWVVATLKQHALKDKRFVAQIERRITHGDDPFAPWQVALAQNALPHDEPRFDGSHWSLDGIEQNAQLDRRDLTAETFFTIDGEHTRDMDDALMIRQHDNGWQITVAIADPSAFIAPQSDVDQEAERRGFTVYLPGRNIPMLPRMLADELCSLQPGKKRATLCCVLDIAPSGELRNAPEFFAGWIESKAKLSYNQVSDLLENTESRWQPAPEISEQLMLLEQATRARINWRENHEAVFPEQADYAFQLDSQGQVIAIHCQQRRIAHRMVEEAMIAANHQAGRLLARELGSGIFNVHPGIAAEKIDSVTELLRQHSEQGAITVDLASLASLQGYCQLRRELADQAPKLDLLVRKQLAFGEMATQPDAHFGLGLDAYATWTSPIRKYGDMVNHRLIKQILQQQPADSLPQAALTEHLSDCRRRNRRVERDVADWLYCRYYSENSSNAQRHNAEIVDVNRGGMRVRLTETGAMAFVPASMICKERKRLACQVEQGTIQLDGQDLFHLGDQLAILLVEVNHQSRSLLAKPADKPA